MHGVRTAVACALAMAAVSTFGDFIWATFIPQHRPMYGTVHGTLLLASVGLCLGIAAGRAPLGALGGAAIGLLAARIFYLLAPMAGYSVMFVIWFALWLAIAALDGRALRPGSGGAAPAVRGLLAAIGSGLAFYAVSDIWMPFGPSGWDHAVHFGSWTVAYLPAFLALLVATGRPS